MHCIIAVDALIPPSGKKTLRKIVDFVLAPHSSITLQLVSFLAVVALFYLAFPAFLPQNHDAQNFYFFVSQKLVWSSSPFELFAFSPLHGAGSTFWPTILEALPHVWIFSLVNDPMLRIYGVQVAAAVLFFGACLFLYRSLGFRSGIAMAAAWLAFLLVMIHNLAYISSPDNLGAMLWMVVSIGSLHQIGYGGPLRTLVFSGATVISVLCFTLAVPSWHVIALPAFFCFAFFGCLSAPNLKVGLVRGVSVLAPIGLQVLAGEYEALYYAMTDTARVMLAGLFPDTPRYRTLAGHMFVTTWTDLLVGALFILGVTSLQAKNKSSRVRAAVNTQIATLAFYSIMTAVALAFLFLDLRWRLPNPKYMLQFALPWVCLYVVIGIRRYADAARGAFHKTTELLTDSPSSPAVRGCERAGWWVVIAYLVLHALAPSQPGFAVFGAVAFLVALAILVHWRLHKTATMTAVAVVIFMLARHLDASFGGGADWRLDGVQRMGLVKTPVVSFLAERTGLVPGSTFRGRVEDLYTGSSPRDITEHVVGHWSTNWQTFGSGHKLFAWNVFGIPTLSEYHQYTKPLFYSLFARFLTERDDVPGISYTVVTRPNEKLLEMFGVRYIVRDSPESPFTAASMAFTWDKFRVFELQHPNLGNYSPSRVILAATATEALSQMASSRFDPMYDVILHAPLASGEVLLPGTAELSFIRGGWRATARGRRHRCRDRQGSRGPRRRPCPQPA